MSSVFTPALGEYEIAIPRPCTCQLCDNRVAGVIRKELYGSALMVCEPCFHQLDAKKHHPYSTIIHRFAKRASGYQVNVKMARAATADGQPWLRYG